MSVTSADTAPSGCVAAVLKLEHGEQGGDAGAEATERDVFARQRQLF
ncbi:hypothetical protein [Luteimonas yindakuii]|nr:hypothetical protein [Luteimonas yindakuii]